MDSLSKEKRSWNMSRIRSANTAPEKVVRSLLHSMGLRFRLKNKSIPGNPDIAMPRHATVIFVHGCFWHRHEGCKMAYHPKSNQEFWRIKFQKNKERDAKVTSQLSISKWHQLIVWECETQNIASLEAKLADYFGVGKIKKTSVATMTKCPA